MKSRRTSHTLMDKNIIKSKTFMNRFLDPFKRIKTQTGLNIFRLININRWSSPSHARRFARKH